MTIVECIKKILKEAAEPLTVDEVYESITKKNLYQFNSKAPKTIVRQQLRRHCSGLSFPSSRPNKYFFQPSKNTYALLEYKDNSVSVESTHQLNGFSERIPEENIQLFHSQHIKEIKGNLIDKLLNVEPSFFEQLVLDLLLKMGYGTNGSVSRRGEGADGGIDGEIFQDKLGLDRIYTQAKRYSLIRPVEEREVRDFVGALQNISKGVFITTSRFTKSAIRFATSQQQKTLVLIDGEKLAHLMVEFELGIQKTYTYSTFQVDSDYFG